MKRIISALLVFLMLFSVVPPVNAAGSEAQTAADALHALGLFNGTGTDADGNPVYELDRAPTRHEAVTMLVRLLGKEEEAKAGTWEIPFTDVAEWAVPYVGYAYANGLTSGTSETTFSGNELVTASQYITFVLRALGYDSNADFQWDKAWLLSDRIGVTDGGYNETTAFTRGDAAIVSYRALSVNVKGATQALKYTLPVPDSVKKAVREEIKEGMDCRKEAIRQHTAEETASVDTLKKTKEYLEKAVSHFEQAIDLCEDYAELKDLRVALRDLIREYNKVIQVKISFPYGSEYAQALFMFYSSVKGYEQKVNGCMVGWP